jgi:hypothetical protein
METLRQTAGGTLVAPLDERSPTPLALHYTAVMLQRTTASIAWPERVDYLIVERIARDIRNQYVASLLGRAKRALARRFARGARPSIGGAR